MISKCSLQIFITRLGDGVISSLYMKNKVCMANIKWQDLVNAKCHLLAYRSQIRVPFEQAASMLGLLSQGTIDIWGQIILSPEGGGGKNKVFLCIIVCLTSSFASDHHRPELLLPSPPPYCDS